MQTGIGRTGAWFAHQNPASTAPVDAVADVVTVAKGLAGGFPIGACIALGRRRRPAPARQPRHHVRRQPGRLPRPALAVLDTIEAEGLLEHVTEARASGCATAWPPTRGSPRSAAPAC